MRQYDVIVIGAGVSGCAIARQLARRERRIAVLEKASDVCEGTSKANSGIVHAGYDAMPGTLKAKLNVRGNEMMDTLAGELDFPFKRTGSLVLCFEKEGLGKLAELKHRGEQNGVRQLRLLSAEEVWELEPAVSKEVAGALYAPTAGIVCPFGMNIAMAENAAVNGVDFFLNHEVTGIRHEAEGPGQYILTAAGEEFAAPVIVNAAGIHADEMHNLVSAHRLRIVPRRGEYRLMDKNCGNLVHSTIFQLPSRLGKGILVTPTVHGNLLVGPTAEDVPEKTALDTTAQGMERVLELGARSVEGLDGRQTITSFAGLRAHIAAEDGGTGDFVIGEAEGAKGFYDVAGIESPGLSCAPALGEYVAEMIDAAYPAPLKEDFIATRKGIKSMALATNEERKTLIAENPAYANVICRCELVTEGEILEAIHRPLGAVTLDGVKRRVRAGMGRCQSGFCSPKVLEILARELGLDLGEITKMGGGSRVLTGYNKQWK